MHLKTMKTRILAFLTAVVLAVSLAAPAAAYADTVSAAEAVTIADETEDGTQSETEDTSQSEAEDSSQSEAEDSTQSETADDTESGSEDTGNADGENTSTSSANISLNTSEITLYVSDDCYIPLTTDINVKSSTKLSEDNGTAKLTLKSSKTKVSVYGELENNVLSLTFHGSGTSTITVTINEQSFQIKVSLIKISASTDAVLLSPGKTKKVTVKGVSSSAKVKWSSSNKKVAAVNKKGKITAKKAGNAVITATINGQTKVGCAVSVTSAKKVNTIKRAIQIYNTSSYSQPRRMSRGYYDCSSLVWRTYSRNGYYFGSGSTAPVAAGIASYLNRRGKLRGSYSYKDTQNMVMQAGDLLFKTGSSNGRYRGIYHVEMFAGYALAYYNTDGDPVVTTTWATRADGYADSGALYGRP